MSNRMRSVELSVSDVAAVLFKSEGTHSANKFRAKAHSLAKHRAPTFEDIRMITRSALGVGLCRRPNGKVDITAFRTTIDMCQAAETVLNSAWGRHARREVSLHEVGVRGVCETSMQSLLVRTGEAGDLAEKLGLEPGRYALDDSVALGLEQMSRALMIIEAAPPSFGYPFKIHTFFPIRTYEHDGPSFELIGLNGKPLTPVVTNLI